MRGDRLGSDGIRLVVFLMGMGGIGWEGYINGQQCCILFRCWCHVDGGWENFVSRALQLHVIWCTFGGVYFSCRLVVSHSLFLHLHLRWIVMGVQCGGYHGSLVFIIDVCGFELRLMMSSILRWGEYNRGGVGAPNFGGYLSLPQSVCLWSFYLSLFFLCFWTGICSIAD